MTPPDQTARHEGLGVGASGEIKANPSGVGRIHPWPPDDPDQVVEHDGIGIDVWRWFAPAVGYMYDRSTIHAEDEPGKWIPTDAEALAEIEKVVQDAVSLATSGTLTGTQEREIRDHVLRALGLTT